MSSARDARPYGNRARHAIGYAPLVLVGEGRVDEAVTGSDGGDDGVGPAPTAQAICAEADRRQGRVVAGSAQSLAHARSLRRRAQDRVRSGEDLKGRKAP